MFVEEIRRTIEVAPRCKLPEVAVAMWRALASGQVTEAEAQQLSDLIEAKKVISIAATADHEPRLVGSALPRRVGSRPRTNSSMERRRRWAASGRLPPGIAWQFTLAEQAVLAVVAFEIIKKGGDCRLYHEHIAGLAGVSKSTVRATLRRARDVGIIAIEERRISAWRNLANIVRITSAEWTAWNRMRGQAPTTGGADISPSPTSTPILSTVRKRRWEPKKGLPGTQNRTRDSASPERAVVRGRAAD